jgi:hypothetical protein
VALARPTCLYCGAPLPAGSGPPEVNGTKERPAGDEGRSLVVVDLEDADPTAVAEALGLTLFEATQRCRRRGPALWRALPPVGAEGEVARLIGRGLVAAALSENAVRRACRPRIASGGRLEGTDLVVRTEERATVRLRGSETLLIVKGEISRRYAPDERLRRGRTATLEPGYRIHVHLVHDDVPVELDPGSFDFGRAPVEGSSLLTLFDWLAAVAPETPSDDGFRHEVPAFAPSEGEPTGPAAATQALKRRGGTAREPEAPSILDNLAQFRFYSGWRGAAERRQPFRHPR